MCVGELASIREVTKIQREREKKKTKINRERPSTREMCARETDERQREMR